MNKLNKLTIGLALSTLSLACVVNGDDSDSGQDTETGGTSPSTMSTTNGMTTTNAMTTAGDTTEGMTMGQTGDDTTAGTGPDTEGSSSSTAIDPGPFVADDPDPALYTRVDRMGMPALNTALIPTDEKDNYNNADPDDDTALQFQANITGSIDFLLDSLTDDFEALDPPLPVCPDVNQCYNVQANPFIIPDTLKLDLSTDSGFPNGRTLTDQVIDLSLAVLILDLVPPGATTLDVLANVPVNPAANDEEFSAEFPFLAAAH
jgi:hypothetical protein